MPNVNGRIQQLRNEYASAGACAAYLLCDRHPPEAVAFTLIEKDLSSLDITFGELRRRSEQLASGLAAQGVVPGDRIATLMGKSMELVVSMLALWRLGAVQVPLFTAFAPAAIAVRVAGNGTKFVITDAAQRPKLDPGADLPAERDWGIITTGTATGDDLSFHHLVESSAPLADPVACGGTGTLVELFTSGTTGTPKAVPIPLGAVAAMVSYNEFALGHTDEDVFWNAADPGWAYGLYYAIISPLASGRRSLMLCASFDAQLTWSVLQRFGVTNFAAAPTVYRALRSAPVPNDLALRHLSSAGEPLTPSVIDWASQALGLEIRDHYGQTETGMIAANAWHPELVAAAKSGSMGPALPGFALEVLRTEADEIADVDEPGRLAVDITRSPLMTFRGYRDAPEKSAARFSGDGRWYLTGDVVSRDVDGHFRFASREDDLILMAGYRIGPFEVESVLTKHSAVVDAAVIGVPDELRGEVLIAIVVLAPGVSPEDSLVEELQHMVKEGLSAHAYPRRVHFTAELPRTPSGKVQRFRLRQQFSDNT